MTSSADPPRAQHELQDVIQSSSDADPITLTDSGGSVAHFEMSYSPPTATRVSFMVPLRQRVPSLVYLAVSLVVVGIVLAAYAEPGANGLFSWIVRGDRTRHLPSQVLAIVLVVTALSTVLRAHLRGIVLHPEWIETRTLLLFGIPQTRRWGWVQVNRIVIDPMGETVGIELLDGGFERLPAVADFPRLRDTFVAHAQKRKIQVTKLEYRPD